MVSHGSPNDMSKPSAITGKQIEHLLRTTEAFSECSDRDIALLLVLYGMALTTTELATVKVSDYLDAHGKIRVTSSVRSDVSHNGEERPLFWSNSRVVASLDKYLGWRLTQKHGTTKTKGAYRGLDPDSQLFLTDLGRPYSLTCRTLPSGVVSASSNALGALLSRLHTNAGIQNGNAQSARKAWAIKQYRNGVGLEYIATLLGHRSITTTKRLVAGEQVELSGLVARAI